MTRDIPKYPPRPTPLSSNNLAETMFKNAVRAARPAIRAARASYKPSTSALRTFSTTVRVQSGGPPPPQLYGEGAKDGTVPTDIEQATGLERLQLLGELEGVNVFDDSPLDASRLGTKANPVLVPSYVRCSLCLALNVSFATRLVTLRIYELIPLCS